MKSTSKQRELRPLATFLALAAITGLIAGCVGAPIQAPQRPAPAPSPPMQTTPEPEPPSGATAPLPLPSMRPVPSLPPAPPRSAELDAAEAALNVGDLEQAKSRINAVFDQSLDPEQLPYLQLINARIAAAEGRPNAVLERLPVAMISAELAAATEGLRADALRELGDFVGAIHAWSERGRWLQGEAREANQEQLWSDLMRAPLTPSDLDRARALGGDVEGWIALGLVARQPAADALDRWRDDYPNHPGQARFETLDSPDGGGRFTQMPLPFGGEWAVLLPLSGPLQSIGEVIRDGWIAAYLKAGAVAPVRFYDAGSTPDEALSAFDQALANGAAMVIGPLRRESVAAIAQRGPLPVPVVALNQLPADMAWVPNLYQFALAPEDEARAAADHAVSQGLRTAVSLLPDNDWGARVEQAFRDRIEALGGRLLSSRRYAPGTDDFSNSIKALMQIGESESRHRQVSAMLGERPVFETRRRADVDFVFFAGRPTDGRLIWSQFRFHRAQDLPAYATSMIYEPGMRPGIDLAGSRFCDMPWMFDDALGTQSPLAGVAQTLPSNGNQSRLFAMGVDAFALASSVARGQASLGYSVIGSTGELWFDVNGAVQRRLDCARFTTRGIDLLPRATDPGRVRVEDRYLEQLRVEDGVRGSAW